MRFVLLSIFLTFCIPALPQQAIIDSLNIELSKSDIPDENRLKILNNLSYENHLINPEKGLELSDKAIELAKKLKSSKGLAFAYQNKGTNYHALSNDSMALLMYDKAIEIHKESTNLVGVAKTTFNKGLIYFGNSDYLRANECNLQAFEIFEKEKDSFLMAKMLNSIGINLMYRSKYSEALDTYLKALKLYDTLNLNNSFDYGSTLANIGILHNKLGNHPLAIDYQNDAQEVYERLNYPIGVANTYNSLGNIYDSMDKPREAIDFYKKAYLIMTEIGNKEGMANALTNIGIAYTSLKNYSKSLEYLNKTKPIYQDLENKNSLSIVFSAIGDNYLKKYEYIGDKKLLDDAKGNFQIALELNNNDNLDFQIQILDELAKVNHLQANYKQAYDIKVQAERLKDSFSMSEKKAEIAKLESEFKYQKKLAQLNSSHEIEQANSQANLSHEKLLKKITIAGSSILILLIIASFLLYKRRKEVMTKALITETELKALRSQMNPHFIFNSLNSISDYVLKNDKESAINYLSKFSKLIRQILENSEKELVPLDEDIAILENYLDIERRRFSNKFSYSINTDKNIDPQNTLIPPLILQPFIENSIIHGFKKKDNDGMINISFTKENNIIICTVEDNGVGRVEKTIAEKEINKTSLGTKITKSRIDILNKQKNTNGSVEIIDKRQGTLVKVSIPLQLAF
ncbi:tetratricopeptide repeat protein [Mangrovimonas sp. DI 80]|uniref:tetratricopeptide repeat-containing sensor histidine kinase n=1 Tax=Mangrovimonas sp. DI 80 TaxID=1779330 RepID=UPI000975CF51|nr:tetratricopeptide repeat protein [Mangrovimonas sp. DI 80]OMP32480.1 hypothetical protein BKM32_05400 [Mangrovimonas sp. DI 80]